MAAVAGGTAFFAECAVIECVDSVVYIHIYIYIGILFYFNFLTLLCTTEPLTHMSILQWERVHASRCDGTP